MTNIPILKEEEILERVGEKSFERGLQYFGNGAIFDTRRQGMTLKACCEGSRANAYRLWVRFDANGIVEANCTCPVGAGGYCKHVVALLLTWADRPEDFQEIEDLDTALESRSKEDLIVLVKQMVRLQPDLESVLTLPLPTTGKQPPVDAESYRRQAASIFRHAGSDYGVEGDIAGQLAAIIEIGDGFADQGDYLNAAIVYAAVSREVCEHYTMFHDEEGELGEIVRECVAGLGSCLENQKDGAEARDAILRALFDVYSTDLDAGGVSLGDEVPNFILDHATADERGAVADWVRSQLNGLTGQYDEWKRDMLSGFLLDLELDTLDDETFLRICREYGRIHDVVERLLSLGRLDEAASTASTLADRQVVSLADAFVRHGHDEVIERLLLERSRTGDDVSILTWLERRYESRGDDAGALELAERIFRGRPSLDGYRTVRDLARKASRWSEVRPGLLAFLNEGHEYHVLTSIYLEEGEIELALEGVRAGWFRQSFFGFRYGMDPTLDVARAAEATYPRAALDIYAERVERLIAQRGRESYRQACGLLARMRDLRITLGESDAWTTYVSDLRERTRALRALKEELALAKL